MNVTLGAVMSPRTVMLALLLMARTLKLVTGPVMASARLLVIEKPLVLWKVELAEAVAGVERHAERRAAEHAAAQAALAPLRDRAQTFSVRLPPPERGPFTFRLPPTLSVGVAGYCDAARPTQRAARGQRKVAVDDQPGNIGDPVPRRRHVHRVHQPGQQRGLHRPARLRVAGRARELHALTCRDRARGLLHRADPGEADDRRGDVAGHGQRAAAAAESPAFGAVLHLPAYGERAAVVQDEFRLRRELAEIADLVLRPVSVADAAVPVSAATCRPAELASVIVPAVCRSSVPTFGNDNEAAIVIAVVLVGPIRSTPAVNCEPPEARKSSSATVPGVSGVSAQPCRRDADRALRS